MLILTNEYLMAHGRDPKGRGKWVFIFDRHHDRPWMAMAENGSTDLTYGLALRIAKREAKRRGAKVVEVSP